MSTTESLCPGYRQVESFGPDEEYEDEEVSYVTLDLGANVEPTLLASSSTYRLIGLDTPTPFMQLSGTIFKGQHDSLLGTEILFTEEKDGADRTKKVVVPIGTTEQRIRFKEVQLKRKSNGQQQQHPSADPLTFVHENLTSAGEATNMAAASNIVVDRITGKSVPAPGARASRSKGKEKKEAKEKKEKKTRKKTKSKGKEKETEPEPEATGETQNKDDEDVTMENTDIPVVGEQADPDGGELMDIGDA